jgi:hypothetical protein
VFCWFSINDVFGKLLYFCIVLLFCSAEADHFVERVLEGIDRVTYGTATFRVPLGRREPPEGRPVAQTDQVSRLARTCAVAG